MISGQLLIKVVEKKSMQWIWALYQFNVFFTFLLASEAVNSKKLE